MKEIMYKEVGQALYRREPPAEEILSRLAVFIFMSDLEYLSGNLIIQETLKTEYIENFSEVISVVLQ